MPRRTLALIDLAALRHNYRLAQDRAGSAQAMAVVKADGYGHGIVSVAGALAAEAGKFAVACIEEAMAVRTSGLHQPIVLLQGVHTREDLEDCVSHGFEPVLHYYGQLDWLAAGPVPQFWLKVNTGMNRLGFRPDELASVISCL